MAKKRKARRNPLEIVLLEEGHTGKGGSGQSGRRVRVNRKSGAMRAKGWEANLKIDQPWVVTVDARDLGRYIGNDILPIIKSAFRANADPETGGKFAKSVHDRISRGWRGIKDKNGSTASGMAYLADNLRRTFMAKNYPTGGKWTNQRRAMLRIYFSPGSRKGRGGYPNPAAAFNQLMQKLGYNQLGIGGKLDGVVSGSIDRWLKDVLKGEDLGRDTIGEAFGRTFR